MRGLTREEAHELALASRPWDTHIYGVPPCVPALVVRGLLVRISVPSSVAAWDITPLGLLALRIHRAVSIAQGVLA